jgi:hypothetical protein
VPNPGSFGQRTLYKNGRPYLGEQTYLINVGLVLHKFGKEVSSKMGCQVAFTEVLFSF